MEKDKKKTEPVQPQKKEESKRDRLYIILIILLLLSNGVLGWLYFNTSTELTEVIEMKTEVEDERTKYRNELVDMLEEYENLETENDEIRAEIEAEKEKIKELIDELDRYKYDNYKLKKETETLRTIMKDLYVQVDSLNTLNKELEAENVTIKNELTTVTSEKEKLQTKTKDMEEIITTGSVLQAIDINSTGIKVRGSGKQVETNRTRRTDMIRSCFRIAENKIAKKGERNIYMRVITPDGKVLAESEDNMFDFEGVEGLYSVKRQVDYENKEMEVCIYHDMKGDDEELPGGEYITEIYEEGTLIGRSKFELKSGLFD